MARAVLNWSLDDLAEASGAHRNTISNFETGKYRGEREKVAAMRRALEAAGVIFIDENGEGLGVRLRRFRVGDVVRFRPQTRVRFSFGIGPDEVGAVVAVESHPPQTGSCVGRDTVCRPIQADSSRTSAKSIFVNPSSFSHWRGVRQYASQPQSVFSLARF